MNTKGSEKFHNKEKNVLSDISLREMEDELKHCVMPSDFGWNFVC